MADLNSEREESTILAQTLKPISPSKKLKCLLSQYHAEERLGAYLSQVEEWPVKPRVGGSKPLAPTSLLTLVLS